jgi:hypothetical protein
MMTRALFIFICLAVFPAGCASSENGYDAWDADGTTDFQEVAPDGEADVAPEPDLVEVDRAGDDGGVDADADAPGDPPETTDVPDADGVSDPDIAVHPGENCSNPIEITLSGSSATVSGNTTGMIHDYDGPPACGIPSAALDIVYMVDVPGGNRLTASYTAAGVIDCISVQPLCPDPSYIGGCTCGDPDTKLDYSRDYAADGTAYIFIWTESGKTFDLAVSLAVLP